MAVHVTGWVVLASIAGVGAVHLLMTGWTQARPPLQRVITHLRREVEPTADAGAASVGSLLGARVLRILGRAQIELPGRTQLRLLERPAEVHAGYMAAAALTGALAPLLLTAGLQAAGVISIGMFAPAGLGLVGLIVGPVLVHADTVSRADLVRIDLRHQLSAYLDVVTMLLAGNTGHEGALEHAAAAGDGRLFLELRRRMREVGATGHSLVNALGAVGRELGVIELEQVAATAALSASEGAPVARSLAAKCATLRSTLSSEQETEARLRTGKLTAPMVGMSLVFMALVVYPALNFT